VGSEQQQRCRGVAERDKETIETEGQREVCGEGEAEAVIVNDAHLPGLCRHPAASRWWRTEEDASPQRRCAPPPGSSNTGAGVNFSDGDGDDDEDDTGWVKTVMATCEELFELQSTYKKQRKPLPA
jgi:hypothetical protein